jgi:beta-lactamase regulating signal transducer with metallopeptidase domain
MGSGIALIVVGAILEFAVTVTTKGFNLHTIGMILLIVGIAAFIVGLLLAVAGRTRHSVQREDIRNTPTGQERVVEERDNLAL